LGFFSEVCAAAGVELIKVELEAPPPPPWESICKDIRRSQLVFVSLSEPLLDPNNRHTQNWVDYEVGLACANNLAVWVFEPAEIHIPFAVPYCTHAVRLDHAAIENVQWLRDELKNMKQGTTKYGLVLRPTVRFDGNEAITCTNGRCSMTFYQLNREGSFWCPSCGNEMYWTKPTE